MVSLRYLRNLRCMIRGQRASLMHRTVTRTHLKASLVVNLLYLIRLNVHVVGRSQLVVVVLRVVFL